MRKVRKVEPLTDFRLRLTFEDGRARVVDLAPHLDGEVFEPLRNKEYFRTVRVDADLDTIVWDNGADVSPDFLFEIGQDV
jgi:hypothetical protein